MTEVSTSPRNRATVVWLVLTLATGLSWLLSVDQDRAVSGARMQVTVGILLIAFFKVRLVILHFMEVRTAPWMLRVACEAWVVFVCSLLVVLYLSGPR